MIEITKLDRKLAAMLEWVTFLCVSYLQLDSYLLI